MGSDRYRMSVTRKPDSAGIDWHAKTWEMTAVNRISKFSQAIQTLAHDFEDAHQWVDTISHPSLQFNMFYSFQIS